MTAYYLGIDVGGSKTHALVADEVGKAIGFGKGGPGNHEVVGYDGLINAMQTATSEALSMAGISGKDICGAGFGIAGYDFPSERQPTLDAISTLGLIAPVEAVNDMTVGLIAGTSEGWGIAIDSGSGTNCRGRNRDGKERSITGCGFPFGEYGSAWDIVMRAQQMVAYEWNWRGPKTRLTQAFIELTGTSDLDDLIEGLALGHIRLDGSYAPTVFKVANEGDPVAREVIEWVGRELGWCAIAIIRQLEFHKLDFEVVLFGSTFNGGALFIDPLCQTVWNEAPGAKFIRLTAPPVVGGVLLGMEKAGVPFQRYRQALIDSTSLLLKA